MKGRNAEGYPDPTAARAIKAADRPPEEIIMFRKMIILHSCIKERLSLLQKKTQDCEKSAVYGDSILRLLQHRRLMIV